ncbi:MAG: acyl-CoA dehydrogenase family protein [Acidimicrobiia bacterium]
MAVTQRDEETESVEAFSARVRAWAAEHLTPIGATGADDRVGRAMEAAGVDPTGFGARGRFLLRLMDDAGFGGLGFPKAYGGQGLTPAHLRAFNAAVADYDMAALGGFTLTLGMNAPAMLEYGTEEQKRRYLPRMFRGEDVWIQLLSEPTGGSDLASAITRADRDGDEWVISGSKIWTSGADHSDMGMIVARTNWEAPKHRGLSVFIVPMDAPGLTIVPLRLVSGQTGFCQEFFDDVRVPADALLGDLNEGWGIASRLLVHERNVLNGGSEYYLPPGGGFAAMMTGGATRRDDLVELALATGQAGDPHVRQLVAEAYVNGKVGGQSGPRVVAAMSKGLMPPAASSILKLINSNHAVRRSDIAMELVGSSAVAWKPDDLASKARGIGYLSRQTAALVSGTSEIQRNIISERVLDLPREAAPDREMPFNQVRHNTMPSNRS